MEKIPDKTTVPTPLYFPDAVLIMALPSMNTVPLIVSVCVVLFHEISPPAVLQLYEPLDGVRSCTGVVLLRVVSESNTGTGTVPLEVKQGNDGPGDAKVYQKSSWVEVSVGVCA